MMYRLRPCAWGVFRQWSAAFYARGRAVHTAFDSVHRLTNRDRRYHTHHRRHVDY